MPQFLKIIEQQVRLVPQSGSILKSFKRALILPFEAVRKYRQSVVCTDIVVNDDFDQEHGTETSLRVHVTDLNIAQPNWIHASPYFPTPSRLLAEILHSVANIDLASRLKNLTFIDLGCGKGRVLLMASQLPFKKIVGVELSQELSATAERNIKVYQGVQLCGDIEVRTMDFTEYKFPDDPLFVFLYNPASLALSQVLARNLMRSIAKHPREVWILYVTPHEVFENESTLEKVRSGECLGHPYNLYRTLTSLSLHAVTERPLRESRSA